MTSPSLLFLQHRVATLSERLEKASAEATGLRLRIEELEGLLVIRTEERDLAREQLADKDEQLDALADYAAEIGELALGEPTPPEAPRAG